MTQQQRFRLTQFSAVKTGTLSLIEASIALELSYSQTKRAYGRWMDIGDQALIHGLVGKPPNRKPNQALRDKAMRLYRKNYDDFGPTLAAEYLAEQHGLTVASDTLRLWAIAEGLWVPNTRRPAPAHRTRRPRRARFGELVQLDGSPHDWFEGRGPRCTLMVMVDDATGLAHARFSPVEDTEAAYRVFRGWVSRYGLPLMLYPDRAGIYRVNRPNGETDHTDSTHFADAMALLSVGITCAGSPQAKGRVERENGVFQDRLVKALRIKGIQDMDAANAFLESSFLDDINAKFAVAPADPEDAHRPLAQGLPKGRTLDDILVWDEHRTVGKDWCLSFDGRVYQVDAIHRSLRLPTRKVTVRRKLDGSLLFLYDGRPLTVAVLPERPVKATPTLAQRVAQRKPTMPPKSTHPWRGRMAAAATT